MPRPELDVHTLRQTTYGACDKDHVVVETVYLGAVILKTDPAKFRKLHKGFYTTYFKSADTVYDGDMNPIPGADAATFKLLEEFHAIDKNNLYTFQNKIPFKELGEPYYFDDAYFFCDKLLAGTRQIWVGKFLIPEVDAGTFELLPYHMSPDVAELRSDRVKKWYIHNETIKHGRDKDGELFICISIQNQENGIAPMPDLPELPLNKPMVLRMNTNEFESWYIINCLTFLEEADRMYRISHPEI